MVITNVILQCHFWWIDWLMRTKLSGKLGSEMSAAVILDKYEVVCARFAVWVTASNLAVLVLVNVVLVCLYFVFKKRNMEVAAQN